MIDTHNLIAELVQHGSDPICESAALLVRDSVKFHFDDMPVIREMMSEMPEYVPPPYPLTFYQWTQENDGADLAVLQTYENNRVTAFVFMKDVTGVWALTRSMYEWDGSKNEKGELLLEFRARDEWPAELGAKFLLPVVAAAQCINEIVACSNVYREEIPAPKFLNRKRVKKGKEPIDSYYVLNLKLSDPASGGGEGDEERKGTVRLHMRRGHIRRCASGKRTWVRSCMVGDAINGTVKKDYKVSA